MPLVSTLENGAERQETCDLADLYDPWLVEWRCKRSMIVLEGVLASRWLLAV
jgi:hypothetical protein